MELELAKLGITIDVLVKDLEDVPELQARVLHLSRAAREHLALVWFGDEGHPQPEKRRLRSDVWFDSYPANPHWTPEWGHLPPLTDDQVSGETRGAKELGIPEREMWWIIERRLDNTRSHSRE